MPADKFFEKIVFLAGPGDVVASGRHWADGVPTPGQSFQTYTAEILNFAREAGASIWVISSNARGDELVLDGMARLTNLPRRRWFDGKGVWFHFGEICYAFKVAVRIYRFRSNAVVVDSGTFHWFLCWLLRLQGTRILASLHNSIYPLGNPPRGLVKRAVLRLNAYFLRHGCSGALFVSPACERQFVEISGRLPTVSAHYVGIYDPIPYEQVPRPDLNAERMTVVYSGRIEKDKGVFDLLDAAAKLLRNHAHPRFKLVYCGGGSALAELQRRVRADPRLLDAVEIRGRLDRVDLLADYGRSHFLVVPTTSRFNEGYAMVCAEAVLCGRPFIATTTVPAIEPLAPACLTVGADDVDGLAARISALLRDRALYLRLAQSTSGLRELFLDPRNGLAAALRKVLHT